MKTTFGSSIAAIKLAELVDNDPKTKRYVSTTLSRFSEMLIKTSQINDIHFNRCVFLLIREHFIKSVEKSAVTSDVKTHLKNVITARYRKSKSSMEWVYAQKRKSKPSL